MSAAGAAPRATLDLRLRVWGMGSNNQPFHQNANCPECQPHRSLHRRARARTEGGRRHRRSIRNQKGALQGRLGDGSGSVKESSDRGSVGGRPGMPVDVSIARRKCARTSPRSRADNRRKFQRHKISFPLEFRDERVNTPMRVNATDISGNGCYVETVMPLPDFHVAARGFLDRPGAHRLPRRLVRTRDPGVGMGIEFTGMPGRIQEAVPGHLDKMDPGIPMPAAKAGKDQTSPSSCLTVSDHS